MKVGNEQADSVTIESANGVKVQITETPQGNLRVTEIGQYIKNLAVIPQSSNSLIITSTRKQY